MKHGADFSVVPSNLGGAEPATVSPSTGAEQAAAPFHDKSASDSNAWRHLLAALHEVVAFDAAFVVGHGDTDRGVGRADSANDSLGRDAATGLPEGWVLPLRTGVVTPVPPTEGGAAHVLDLLLVESAVGALRIRLARSPQRPFLAEDAANIARCSPLLRALARSAAERFEHSDANPWRDGRLGHALLAIFDQLGLGLCLVDAEMHPLLASATALRSGVVRLQQGRLAAADRAADAQLRGAVRTVITRPDLPIQGLRLERRERPLHMLVTAVREHGATGAAPAPRLAALLLLPHGSPQHPVQVIQTLFGLSPVEARIAKLLGDGCTPGEAAERLRIRPNTLRGYIKSIFVKLDVHRQSELVRLVCTTAGLLRGPVQTPEAGAASARAESQSQPAAPDPPDPAETCRGAPSADRMIRLPPPHPGRAAPSPRPLSAGSAAAGSARALRSAG